MKNALAFVAKFGVSAALIWFLLKDMDVSQAKQALLSVDLGWVLAASAVMWGQFLLAAWRWQVVMAALSATLPSKMALRITFIGVFFNQTLPSAVGGDAVRMFLTHKEGYTPRKSISGVMLERLVTVIALIAIVVCLQGALAGRLTDDQGLWLFPLLALGAVSGVAVLVNLKRLPEAWQKWKLVRGVSQLGDDARLLFLNAKSALKALAIAAVAHFNISLAVYFLALGLGLGDTVTVLDCFVLFPIVMLILVLPISIAGWGVRESAMVGLFGLVGVAPESAFALSILVGLVTVFTALPGGLVWLLTRSGKLEIEKLQQAD